MNFPLRSTLFLALSMLSLNAVAQNAGALPALPSAVNTPAAASPSNSPVAGDAYWSGGLDQTAQQVTLPNQSPQVAGDSYWNAGSTVGPTVSSRAAYANSASDVTSGSVFNDSESGESDIPLARASLIQEAAVSFGAQAGMAARTRQLNDAVQGNSSVYDKTFRFSDLMIEPGFLAPVVTEGRDAYQQNNSREVRVADRIYRIEIRERLVSTPPRWQEYVLGSTSSPLTPDRTARPRTKAERAWWDQWSQVGWNKGVAQADQAFSSRLARLRRDFEGMVRFKSLYQQGVITMPILAKSNLGVTGGGDEMAINDRVYQITEQSKLDPNTNRWKNNVPATHNQDLPADARKVKAGPSNYPQE